MNTPDVYYDPYDVAINADPYPTYARLREEAPAYHNEQLRLLGAVAARRRREGASSTGGRSPTRRSDILEIIKSDLDLPSGCRPVREPAGPHDAPGSHVPGLHAAADGRARGPGARSSASGASTRSSAPSGSTSSPSSASCMPMRVIGMLLGIPESDQVAVRDQSDDEPAHRGRQADGRPRGPRSPTGHVRRLHRVARRTPVRRPHDRRC